MRAGKTSALHRTDAIARAEYIDWEEFETAPGTWLDGGSTALAAHLWGSHTPGRFASGWRNLLETGVFSTVEEIAASYVGRVLRLTLLAPDIVGAILDGRQPAAMTLAALMRPFEVGWDRQRAAHPRCR